MGLEDAVELEQRLVVKRDEVELLDADAGLAQAGLDRVLGKIGHGASPGESLLLRGGDELAVVEQARGGVVIVGRDAEDGRHGGRALYARLFRRVEFSSETSAATVLARRTETSMWVVLPAFQESIDC